MKLLTILSAAAVVAVSMPVASAPALAKRYHHPHHRTVHYRTVCKKVRYHHRWVKRCHRVRYYR